MELDGSEKSWSRIVVLFMLLIQNSRSKVYLKGKYLQKCLSTGNYLIRVLRSIQDSKCSTMFSMERTIELNQ